VQVPEAGFSFEHPSPAPGRPERARAREQSPMKTYSVKAGEIQHDWYVVDAGDKILGRVATEVARILRGKHKPTYTPHLDTGDYVVVVNADRVRLSGAKADQKTYFKHTGYMGGEKFIPFKEMLAKHPERIIELAVKGMLPKNTLGRQMRKKLKVYAGAEHPHQAQNPQPLTF
jgi:large subunit ribosomal protein L13